MPVTQLSPSIARHRTLWISDVHLGSPGCQAHRLTRFLAENDCDTLYLVGDIFDGWRLKKSFYWKPDHTRVIKAILTKARHGTKVYYVTGNHDEFMRQFVSKQLRLGRVRLVNEVVHTTADGRRLLVVHGDRFDVVITHLRWLAHVGDVGYEALLWTGARLNRVLRRFALPEVPVSAQIKLAVKSAVQYLSGFDEQVMARCRAEGFKGVVSGHTHHAETRQIRLGIVSYNCGDWVESCTALAEDANGRITILRPGEVASVAADVAVVDRGHGPLPQTNGDAGQALWERAMPAIQEGRALAAMGRSHKRTARKAAP